VYDRFIKQVFSNVENLVIQEYKFYRYLFLTTLKCLFLLFFVPFLVNLLSKHLLVQPITEYFWNQKKTDIFLNSYQQKRAFSEFQNFEEKLYFESIFLPFAISGSLTDAVSHKLLVEAPKWYRETKINTHVVSVQMPVYGYAMLGSTELATQLRCVGPQFMSQPLHRAAGVTWEMATPYTQSPWQVISFTEKGIVLLPEVASHASVEAATATETTTTYCQSTELHNAERQVVLPKAPHLKERTTAMLIPEGGGTKPQSDSTAEFLLQSPAMHAAYRQWTKRRIEKRLTRRTVELAFHYNNESIGAITNFFSDILALSALGVLSFVLKVQISITKSFIAEIFFGLDDSQKSFLILLLTDLLVGYHSSNLWEFLFQFLLNHYGLPENQSGIFFLVATFPVLLDVFFKYLIFRQLNRASPATVATYHSMIE
jgi:hypothetical protein